MFAAAWCGSERAKFKRTSKVYVHMVKGSGHAGNTHMNHILHFQSADLAGVTLANECLDVGFKSWPVKMLMQEC
jgi:hypothetical protein